MAVYMGLIYTSLLNNKVKFIQREIKNTMGYAIFLAQSVVLCYNNERIIREAVLRTTVNYR